MQSYRVTIHGSFIGTLSTHSFNALNRLLKHFDKTAITVTPVICL